MAFGRKSHEEGDPSAAEAQASNPRASSSSTSGEGESKPKEQPVEETQAPKLSEEELAKLPEHVRDAAKRQGGGVPRAAPKGGEGTLDRAFDPAHPELEPTPPPTEYRAAPVGPRDAAERPKYGDKPKNEDLAVGTRVRVRTVDPNAAPIYVAGAYVPREGVELAVDDIRNRSEAHVVQLLADPRIEVELVK